MLQLRAVDTLGGGHHDWLKARHHFAFDSQGNPAHARLGNLVVWNEDEIAPHSGFPRHGHRDMEIVTYVREGVLQHEDSSGGCGEIRAGDVQAIAAGRGIWHSEYNDNDARLRIFQIWLLPRRLGLDPCWATKPIADMQRAGRFVHSRADFPKTRVRCGLRPTPGYSGPRSKRGNALHIPCPRPDTAISFPRVEESW